MEVTTMRYNEKYSEHIQMRPGHTDLKLSALMMSLLVACSHDEMLQSDLPMDALALDFDLRLPELVQYLDTLVGYKYIRYNTDNDVLFVQYNRSLQVA